MTNRSTILVVGAGPAGLTAATELARTHQVVLFDRESAAGGIPRHSAHTGYGIRDLHRVMTGPNYARRLVERAREAGVDIRTESTVTGWAGDHSLVVTSPHGRVQWDADAVILATGARERPRSARLIAGDRPAGVLTTGQLQNMVHLHHRTPGKRAVVVGSELVSWSAVLTLREAGCDTVLMTTERSRPESYALFHHPARVLLSTPVSTATRVVRVIGRDALEAVEVEDVRAGSRRIVECDVLVLTADWIPDYELTALAGLDRDRGTRGPRVDMSLRTSRAGVFAVGNLIHPVDTADVCALDGRQVAGAVRSYLRDLGMGEHSSAAEGSASDSSAAEGSLPDSSLPDGAVIQAVAPLRWIAPSLIRAGDHAPARRRLLLWSDEFRLSPRLVATQDGREVGRLTIPWPAVPGRVLRAPWALLERANPAAGEVRVTLG